FQLFLLLALVACKKSDDQASRSSGSYAAIFGSLFTNVQVQVKTTSFASSGAEGPAYMASGAIVDFDVADFVLMVLPVKNFVKPSPRPDLAFVSVVKSVDMDIFFEQDRSNPISIKAIGADAKGDLTNNLRAYAVGLFLK